MLFNSYEFIFLFLPVVFFTYYFLLSKRLVVGAKGFLVFSSLFFYSWWNIAYLPLILSSMLFNYIVGSSLNGAKEHIKIGKKQLLSIGIIANLGLLGYFKYADFFISNLNALGASIGLLELALPLAISFFTFQQIAYLVDSYRGETNEYDFLNYALFVTFFPQLIAGPIVHHKEMMPQFASRWNAVKKYRNIALGMFIFSMGLFKKVVIADTFAVWATAGFDSATTLTFFEAWATSLSYTFQLYFDFSGYTDMAIGVALLFNIKLPINFNSPYKATDIQDFWRRWHMTLSRFLKDYIYIPLGGNRKGSFRTYNNLMATFILGGLWHGAGWTFVFWGFLHGLALVIHRLWQSIGFKLNIIVAWFITFNFVNIAWVFFRAKEWEDAIKVLEGMFVINPESLKFNIDFLDTLSMWLNIAMHEYLPYTMAKPNVDTIALLYILVAIPIVVWMKNSSYYMSREVSGKMILVASLAFSYAIINSFFTSTEVFLYFNF
ncbi:MAG: MBOAT family protein [Campylobacterota bacterium]|nr:MBOAT family protein [Campylobacterota bacterium]